MADPATPSDETEDNGEVATNRALEKGLGVGARELAAIHDSGEEGTLERSSDDDGAAPDPEIEVGDAGRSASVLDRKA